MNSVLPIEDVPDALPMLGSQGRSSASSLANLEKAFAQDNFYFKSYEMTPFFTSAPAAFINWSRFLMSHKSPKDTILLFPTPQRLEDSSNFHLRVPVYAFR